ncbi:glycolate oxidase FAD binding subunit [Alicyclobacillus sacchari]|uniref:Glycolate oxidase FAD binding subunit n=1 Tax=Alicyclobacillus sacchari TaxID=392010 RepID=A0A4R8LJK9_9BACL|nr:FAD-binding oxidoreductase [Alicyclobacillus sacchari]TDY43972.1 glycolate oxidase FAD binding subunit [Alicyclobacillus sacchari]
MPLQSKPHPADTAEHLANVIGLHHVRIVPACTLHMHESSQDVCLAEPSSEEEVLAVLAYARDHGLSLLPCGAGRLLAYGPPAEAPDIWLSLRRMNRVVSLSQGDLIVSVEPGLTMSELTSTLTSAGLMLPYDPPAPADATLGGLLSAGVSGPRRALYGSLRDMAISLRVALLDGRVIRTGAKVVKNVAGYDMTKLFIGAWGTLGVITEITLKLRPLPMHRETVLAAGTLDALGSFRERIVQSALQPSRLEVVWQGETDKTQDWVLAVDCDEHERSAKAQTQILESMAHDLGLTVETLEQHAADTWWADHAGAISDRMVCIRLQGPPTKLFSALAPVLDTIAALAEEPRNISATAGGITGVARIAFDPARALLDDPACWQKLRDVIAASALEMTVERAPTAIRAQCTTSPFVPGAAAVMQRLKQTFDPEHLLSPGRFLGGM